MLKDGRDVAALLAALPDEMLSPELVALRDLGAAVDLADHWPVVHVTTMPIEHTRLGVAALPAFAGIYMDAGSTSLDWLDAKLPPTMPLTLVVDPSGHDTLSAFVNAWGDRAMHVAVKGPWEEPSPVPDLLGRLVNVQSVTIEHATPPVMTTYLTALPKQHLHTLQAVASAFGPMDASAIVSWLQGPHATSLNLGCSSVSDPTALADAILACTTLRSLKLHAVSNVQEALMASPKTLTHITSLTVVESRFGVGATLGLVKKVDRTKVHTVIFNRFEGQGNNGDVGVNRPGTSVLDTLALCPALRTLRLVRVHIAPIRTTGTWSHLSTVALRDTTFKTPGDAVKLIQWLSTSRCLKDVDLDRTQLGAAGFVELARALPAWMARGLETLNLRGTQLCDDDAAILVIALASGTNRRPLTVNVRSNPFMKASTKLFLGMLGASHNVTLHVGMRRYTDGTRKHMKLHQLVQVQPGVLTSPPRQSSRWHSV
ncbi:hypothetical protein SPRG_09720 [Saprolegnia parasitica CBS 223.65]|uniref:Uncharacterized protein n=1 Tax=Saprolegnia parasitica (strain CBS 223.65) TaxID=695850 RepID=A0A067C748_SAPPC|nr:hypothetical protein SPRG_09720 [Saprolegnia parasitica CBS 223.65]KDO24990.1 hypothetical protein SPRG_09720 [Saprolegnia parasitica CBS 223.65]|eukprot:XP_012204259.1 hypothetical protein SPRG_09720 [Saprolegnia parasitica CBS 223.65]